MSPRLFGPNNIDLDMFLLIPIFLCVVQMTGFLTVLNCGLMDRVAATLFLHINAPHLKKSKHCSPLK
jgi:hypothetical protein